MSDEQKQEAKPAASEVVEFKNVMRDSFGTYAAYVIGHRAIPDVRDGLKPVQRRLLYTAYELGARSDRRFMKSAEVSGTCMGRYHPHGDAYMTMVRMAQDFVMRHPLFEGQGNFGTLSDPAAAARYTEIRLSSLGESLFFSDLNENTVVWKPNYADNRQEPVVLPAELPHLLLNGTDGIAVGLATEILPFNARELIDCLVLELDKGVLSSPQGSTGLPNELKGPDFPTRGIVEVDLSQLLSVWKDGRGRFRVRGTAHFETNEEGRRRVVVDSLPWHVDPSELVTHIAQLTSEKNDEGAVAIPGVAKISDTTTQDGVRVVLDLERNADPQVVLNMLYQKTRLQETMSCSMVVLDNDRPRRIGICDALLRWLDFRREVVRNSLNREKRLLNDRKELVDAYLRVHADLDKVIKIIRKSQDAVTELKRELTLTQRQAEAVCKLPLGRLRKLDQQELEAEHAKITARVGVIDGLLADKRATDALIKERLLWWKTQLDERRSSVVSKFGEISALDTVVKEDVVLTINQRNEAKTTRLSDYRQTGRRSAGVMETRGEETNDAAPKFVVKVTTHDMLLLFTDQGRCHELMGAQIPVTPRRGKASPLQELFTDLKPDERAIGVLSFNTERVFPDSEAVVLLCSSGEIKRLSVNSLLRHRGTSCDCMALEPGVKLIGVEYVQPDDLVAVFTKKGFIRCFLVESVRLTNNKKCGGVMTASPKDDELLSIERVSSSMKGEVLVVSNDGFAVRVPLDKIPVKKGRYAQGNRIVRLTGPDSSVVYAGCVQDGDLVFLTTSALRSAVFDAAEVREAGRGSRGVRVGRLTGDEKIVAAACVKTNTL